MSSLTVSVVLATHNGEEFLWEQLRSLGSQSRPPQEVIVVDDQSRDSSTSIVRAFAQESLFPVRLVELAAKRGSTGAFEVGIGRSDRDVIILCDQDDRWYSNKIEELMRRLETHSEVGLVYSDAVLVDRDGGAMGETLWQRLGLDEDVRRRLRVQPFEMLLRGPIVTGMTMALRRSALRKVLPIPRSWHHDAWIAIVLSLVAGFEDVAMPLGEYRVHPSQQTYFGPQLDLLRTGRDVKAQRFARGAARWFELARAIGERRVGTDSEWARGRIEQKARYLAARSVAYQPRGRVSGVLRGICIGGYWSFDKGARTVVVDLFNVARPHSLTY